MFQILSKLYFLQNILSYFICRMIPPFLVHNTGKYFALKKAFYIAGMESIHGSYIEFGVFTGSSFSCAIDSYRGSKSKEEFITNFIGFDSFEGFGELEQDDKHPFFSDKNFQTSYDNVHKRIKKKAKNESFKLIKGYFSKTCDNINPSQYGIDKTSIALIDSDTYTSANSAFNFLTSTVQTGTILVIDDFFSYKGSSKKGTKKAFDAWLDKNPHIKYRKICDYGIGGVMLIIDE